MSYNITKISSKEPDSQGSVVLNLADVTDATSPSNNQVLVCNGTKWLADNITVIAPSQDVFHSTNTPGSGPDFPSGLLFPTYSKLGLYERAFPWHKSATSSHYAYTQTTNTTNKAELLDNVNSPTETMHYGIRFNTAGVYRVFAKIPLSNLYGAAGSYVTVQWSNYDNTVVHSPRYNIQRWNDKSVPAICVVNATEGQIICLYMHSYSGSPNYPLGSSFNDYLIVVEKLD